MGDLDIVQALFHTKPISGCLNWPVDVGNFVEATRELRVLCRYPDSSPSEIAKQWRKINGALGMDVMAAMFDERGEWQQLAYQYASERKPWREHDDYVVLWEQPAGCVVARVQRDGDVVTGVEFDVRKEV